MSVQSNNYTSLFFNNLFGTIAGNSGLARLQPGIDFIPIDNAGKTLEVNGRNAEWLGLQNKLMQLWAYQFCYPLASVVDRLAEADLNGEVEILRSKGKGKEDYATSPYAKRLKKLLDQPNPLQTWEQFRGQQLVYKRIFGFCPVLPLMPAGIEDPSYCLALINLPPWYFEVEGTKKFQQTSVDRLVKAYKYKFNGEVTEFQPNQLFILEDSFLQDEQQDFLLPKSRLVGLDMAVSNICAAMEADNVLLKKKGPLGFISHDAAATKDSVAGYLPMTPTERNDLQDTLARYGLSWAQFQYAISRTAVKWNAMSFDTKQLGTKETVVAGERAICHRFGYSYILYEDSGATYANQNGAHKSLYQNVVIPNANKDIAKFEKFFKAEENACEICISFDDLPILQEDEKEKAHAAKSWNDAYMIEYKNGLITLNQWRTARGYETTPDGDTYYTAPAVPDPKNEDEIKTDTKEDENTPPES